MFGLSFWEIAVIAVVALVVLGPKRLPGVLKTVGQGLRSLRRASSDIRSVIDEPLREVRQPLEDIKNDLYQTVHQLEEQVEAAASEDEDASQDEDAPQDENAPQDEDAVAELDDDSVDSVDSVEVSADTLAHNTGANGDREVATDEGDGWQPPWSDREDSDGRIESTAPLASPPLQTGDDEDVLQPNGANVLAAGPAELEDPEPVDAEPDAKPVAAKDVSESRS
jgi:sec-independent protein translocase protein TatB